MCDIWDELMAEERQEMEEKLEREKQKYEKNLKAQKTQSDRALKAQKRQSEKQLVEQTFSICFVFLLPTQVLPVQKLVIFSISQYTSLRK